MHTGSSVTFKHVADNTILTVQNQSAEAEISLFGGHVLSFTPKHDGIDRLWMSPQANIDGSQSIRGGVPVCWPWFSDQFPATHSSDNKKPLPAHGYARTSNWQIASIEHGSNDKNSDAKIRHDKTIITLSWCAKNLPGFPYEAQLHYVIEVAEELQLTLKISNIGKTEFDFTGALHTYFTVDNVEHSEIKGLTGNYKDKTKNFAILPTPDKYQFNSETDRIHLTQDSIVTINQEHKETSIEMSGHDSIVVWNPGKEGVKAIKNVPDSDYLKFLCVEAAVTSTAALKPGDAYSLVQRII